MARRNFPRFDKIYFQETKEIPGVFENSFVRERAKARENKTKSKQTTTLEKEASVTGAKRGGGM